MNDLFDAARRLQEFCDSRGWRSCFIGGLAVQRWSEPRVTRDADLTVLAGFGNEDRIIDPLLEKYAARIPDAREYALRHRVILLAAPGPVGLDILLGALPYEERLINRATLFTVAPGIELRTCSAEDLLVLKLFAGRALDIRDAEGVVLRNGNRLDWLYVEEQLRPIAEAKEDPGMLQELARLRGLLNDVHAHATRRALGASHLRAKTARMRRRAAGFERSERRVGDVPIRPKNSGKTVSSTMNVMTNNEVREFVQENSWSTGMRIDTDGGLFYDSPDANCIVIGFPETPLRATYIARLISMMGTEEDLLRSAIVDSTLEHWESAI